MKNKAIALLCAGALLAGSSASAAGITARPTTVQASVSRTIAYQSQSVQQLYYQMLNTWVSCKPSQSSGSGSQQKPGSSQGSGSGSQQKPGSSQGSGSGSQQKPGSSQGSGSGSQQKPGGSQGSGSGSQQKPGSSQGSGSNQNTAQQPSGADSVRSQILSLVNQARAEAGLKPLSTTNALNSAAQTRAQELSQLYSHNRPDGSSCFTVLGERGISYRTAGENIATGYKTAQQVFNAWMNSEGHRKNILSEKFTQIGIGYTAQQGWTQLFIG